MKLNTSKSFLFVIGFCVMFSCKDSVNNPSELNKRSGEEMFYRTAAYNSLNESQKATIISDWQSVPVFNGIYVPGEYGEPNILIEGQSSPLPYDTPLSRTFDEGTKLKLVTFQTENDALIGPITVIMLEDGTVIGAFTRL